MNRIPASTLALSFSLAIGLGACAMSDEPTQSAQPIYGGPTGSPFRYPESLWDAGIEGESLLMVRVSAQGGVDSVYVETTSGHAAMDSAALTGARELRFRPATRAQEPVAAWVRLPVRFSMDGGAAQGALEPSVALPDTAGGGNP